VYLENRLEEGPIFFMGVAGITWKRVPCKLMSLLKEIVRCLFRVRSVSDASIRNTGAGFLYLSFRPSQVFNTNKPTRCNPGSIVFINKYKYALHVSEALVTVYSAPDDGHKGRPKHVEHTCSC